MSAKAFSHCAFCGTAFVMDAGWPRLCHGCSQTTYRNPLPVAVVLVPVDAGVLLVRRAFGAAAGKLALPGGFIELGESWQAAGAREVWEEASVRVDPAGIVDNCVHSAPDGTLLVFGLAAPLKAADLGPFEPNDEVSERVVGTEAIELAFPLHTQVLKKYFDQRAAMTREG